MAWVIGASRAGEVFRAYRGGVLHVHSTGFHGGDLVHAGREVGTDGGDRANGARATTAAGRLCPTGCTSGLRDRLLAKVICVSAGNRHEHIAVLGRSADKLTVVPNGIDVERFAAADGAGVHAGARSNDDVRLVGVVVRLAEERKGIAEFLRMAAMVAPAHPDAHFVVVGDGPLRSSLEQLAGRPRSRRAGDASSARGTTWHRSWRHWTSS